jgi:hypothetical protein
VACTVCTVKGEILQRVRRESVTTVRPTKFHPPNGLSYKFSVIFRGRATAIVSTIETVANNENGGEPNSRGKRSSLFIKSLPDPHTKFVQI